MTRTEEFPHGPRKTESPLRNPFIGASPYARAEKGPVRREGTGTLSSHSIPPTRKLALDGGKPACPPITACCGDFSEGHRLADSPESRGCRVHRARRSAQGGRGRFPRSCRRGAALAGADKEKVGCVAMGSCSRFIFQYESRFVGSERSARDQIRARRRPLGLHTQGASPNGRCPGHADRGPGGDRRRENGPALCTEDSGRLMAHGARSGASCA